MAVSACPGREEGSYSISQEQETAMEMEIEPRHLALMKENA
jgi:hypothetical protein